MTPDAGYTYFKRDEKAMLITRAKTTAFWSRVLHDVTTQSIPIIEELGYGWFDHRDGFHAQYDKTILDMVTLRNPREEIEISHFFRESRLPSQVTVKEWDVQPTGARSLKVSLSLRDRPFPIEPEGDGRFDQYYCDRYTSVGMVAIRAWDENRDGSFDDFRITLPDGSVRIEKDRDFDGLLDVLEMRTPNKVTTVLLGNDIPDRKVRTFAIPVERIQALIQRAKAGSPQPKAPVVIWE
jgi:hypothetical protein